MLCIPKTTSTTKCTVSCVQGNSLSNSTREQVIKDECTRFYSKEQREDMLYDFHWAAKVAQFSLLWIGP